MVYESAYNSVLYMLEVLYAHPLNGRGVYTVTCGCVQMAYESVEIQISETGEQRTKA